MLHHFEAPDGVVAGFEGRDEVGRDVGVADYLCCAEGCEEGDGDDWGKHGRCEDWVMRIRGVGYGSEVGVVELG